MSSLTDAIGAVCRLITTDPNAEAVARELGEIVDQQTSALRVRPRDEHFDDAYVVREDDGPVSHVELTLCRPASPDELAEAFGDYREPPRVDYDRPRTLHFAAGDHTVIARLEDERVTAVTVRNDA